MNFNCKKATATIDETAVEVWYSLDIPVASGPDSFFGLPGMILEVKTKTTNREKHIIAEAVNFKEVEKNKITAPKKGKKVTQEEFRKIVEEKTKEMQQMTGGGTIMIQG